MKKYDLVFIVSTLGVHGGTTFVNRFCKYSKNNGKKILVFCLIDDIDPTILSELKENSDVVFLSNYLLSPFNKHKTNQLSIFLPISINKVREIMDGCHIHVMGVFGLYFYLRLAKKINTLTLSIGLYQQNEFNLQKRRDFFSRYISCVLKKTPPQSFVFFNESSKQKFQESFQINDLSSSVLTPIGIDLVKSTTKKRVTDSYRLVSVGNLVGFKTYNKVMISLLPSLLIKYPFIRYDIVGDGPDLVMLERICNELNLQKVVTFHGVLTYENAMRLIERSDVFIGSGTAILESAIRYIPSIIGIECEQEAVTYGFISDIKGFDYNEKMPNVEKVKILECIDNVFSSESEWNKISQACHDKALEFGIDRTYTDFIKLSTNSIDRTLDKECFPNNIFCFVSFLKTCMLDYFNFDKTFRLRRDLDE